MAYQNVYTNVNYNGNKLKAAVIQNYANVAAMPAPTAAIVGMMACSDADLGHEFMVVADPVNVGSYIWKDVHDNIAVIAASTAGFPATGALGSLYQISSPQVIGGITYPAGTIFSWDGTTYLPQTNVSPIINLGATGGTLPAVATVTSFYFYTSTDPITLGGTTYPTTELFYTDGTTWIPIGTAIDDDLEFVTRLSLGAGAGVKTVTHNLATTRATLGLAPKTEPLAMRSIQVYQDIGSGLEVVDVYALTTSGDTTDFDFSNNPAADFVIAIGY